MVPQTNVSDHVHAVSQCVVDGFQSHLYQYQQQHIFKTSNIHWPQLIANDYYSVAFAFQHISLCHSSDASFMWCGASDTEANTLFLRSGVIVEWEG